MAEIKEKRESLVTRTRHDDLGDRLEEISCQLIDPAHPQFVSNVIAVVKWEDVMSAESLESELLFDISSTDNSVLLEEVLPKLREEILEFAADRYKELLIEMIRDELAELDIRAKEQKKFESKI